jgi:hypothetical protein
MDVYAIDNVYAECEPCASLNCQYYGADVALQRQG